MTFKQLDEFLAADFPADYWFDDAAPRAQESVARFSSGDFDELARVWPSRPRAWRERCAYVITGAPRAQIARVLKIFESEEPAIVASAIETLRRRLADSA